MKDLNQKISESLQAYLSQNGLDVVDLIPIPSRGDRMVRIRTLEDALEGFDQADDGESVGYMIKVRLKPEAHAPSDPIAAAHGQAQAIDPSPGFALDTALPALSDGLDEELRTQKPMWDGVYLPDGKLNVPFLSRNADLLFSAGEYALARNIYKSVLDSGERSAMALFGIARCLEADGKPDEAIKNYEESIAYHPTLDAYQRMATLLIQRKKDQQAAELLERALVLKTVSPEARMELHKACGNCYLRADRPELAEKQYKKALEIDPSADSIRANLGTLYLRQGKHLDAKLHFQDAIARNPKNDRALSGLGSCFFATGDKRAAHDYFAKALEVELNNPTAIYYLVKCAYEIRSYATAARLVGEYVQVAPVNTNLLYSLAGLQFHLGRIEEAKVTTTRILELQPSHAGSQELLQLINRFGGPSNGLAAE